MRLTHWVNVIVLLVLLMSGLQIFNAHPALYFGAKSNFDDPVMAMRPMRHGENLVGVITIAGWNIDTTNLFGLAYVPDGDSEGQRLSLVGDAAGPPRPFQRSPLAFLFRLAFVINGLIDLTYSLVSGHLRKDLAPGTTELKHIGASIWEHVRLKFPQGEEAKHYNVLRKLAYLVVALVLLPLMVATGVAMSPGMDAGYPFLLEIFGGRQSARTIHFITRERHRAVRGRARRHGADLGRMEQSPLIITGRYVIKLPEGQA